MSDAKPQSPRAAIRKWLRSTESKSAVKPVNTATKQQEIEWGSRHPSRTHRLIEYASETEDQYEEKARRKRQRHSKCGIRQKRATDEVCLVNSEQVQPRIHPEHNTAVNADGFGLAEKLGLHPPFRTFKDHSDNDFLDFQGRQRKRKHSRSSTSSYLEPAAADDLSDNDHNRHRHATRSRPVRAGPILGRTEKTDLPTASPDSESLLLSPEKLLKSYERRPRNKTRQDRYELKDKSEKTKQATRRDRADKKQKKRKRKEKSGAALMHDFTAHNVAHDRLTLQPTKSLGLFGKGKASSPVRRRGLPDLAFSEMTFLTSRREKPRNSFKDSSFRPSEKKKLRKSNKAVGTEAEVSRYFNSAKPTTPDMKSRHDQRYQQNRMRSRDHESPRTFVDLPDRPFLGFRSCGPNMSTSPPEMPISAQSRSLHAGDARPPTRSTSYLTWSQTEAQSYPSPLLNTGHYVEPLTSSKLLNRQRTPPIHDKDQHSTLFVTPPCVQNTHLEPQGSVPRPPSKNETANEAPSQTMDFWSATGEPRRLNEKSRGRKVTGRVKLDAARISQDTEDSVPVTKHVAEAATNGGKEPVPLPRDQTTCQSSEYEPPCKSQGYDVHLLSAQMSPIGPTKDPLDDILEALLKDCNTNAAGGDLASGASSCHRNLTVSEEARKSDTIEKCSSMSAGPLLKDGCASEAPMSASVFPTKPRSSNLHRISTHDGLRAAHTPSMRSVDSSNRPSLDNSRGCPYILKQSQVDPRNAWNGYDNLYERQQERAHPTPKTSRVLLPPNVTVRNDLSGPSPEIERGAAPNTFEQNFYPVEVGDELDVYRPSYHQETRNEDWDGHFTDHVNSYGCGESHAYALSDGCKWGIRAEDNANDYQQREISAGHERSCAQGADQHDVQHQLFTTDISDHYTSWRPHHINRRNYCLEGSASGTQIRGVDPALSGFWTPQKLY